VRSAPTHLEREMETVGETDGVMETVLVAEVDDRSLTIPDSLVSTV
jgi:hypothetical protein